MKIENLKFKISELRCDCKDARCQLPVARASREIENSKYKIQNFGTLRVDYKRSCCDAIAYHPLDCACSQIIADSTIHRLTGILLFDKIKSESR